MTIKSISCSLSVPFMRFDLSPETVKHQKAFLVRRQIVFLPYFRNIRAHMCFNIFNHSDLQCSFPSGSRNAWHKKCPEFFDDPYQFLHHTWISIAPAIDPASIPRFIREGIQTWINLPLSTVKRTKHNFSLIMKDFFCLTIPTRLSIDYLWFWNLNETIVFI